MSERAHRCLIVDDEALGRELIASHLSQLPQFEVVAMCASAIEAAPYLTQDRVDLMFLDIEMPVLKGTDFYQGLSHKPKVIFTTAHREYAVDGFDLAAVDYLLKPITFARFFRAVERYLNHSGDGDRSGPATEAARDFLFVRADRKEVKVRFSDLLYAKGLKDYVEIHTPQRTWLVKTTLSSLLQSLPPDFLQVHRSYIINKRQVTAYTRHEVEIGEVEIPIGEKFQAAVRRAFR
ncbi:MAG: LytTR family DNA-binding domain-containing protein [Myxococcota bacterium]